jgi:hypothetical protein
MGEGDQRHAPAASPPGETQYPLYRRLGGPQSRSGRVRKFSPPPGFDPRTLQPVAIRYTDWTIAGHTHVQYMNYRGPHTRTVHEIKAHYTNSVSIVQMKVSH